jgi:type I restriction enzyme M protein
MFVSKSVDYQTASVERAVPRGSLGAMTIPGALKNTLAQYFTPEPVARFMTHLLRLEKGRAIDPACGDGVFLRALADERPGVRLHGCDLDSRCLDALRRNLRSKRVHLHQGDALAALQPLWGTFDGAIGNPPFSAQSQLVRDPGILRQFDLGRGRRSQAREIVFLELFIRLVRIGGRFSIILPEGVAAKRPLRDVRNWLLMNASIDSIVSLPRRIFRGTPAKCIIVTGTRIPATTAPRPRITKLAICKDILQHIWSLLPALTSERRSSGEIVRANLREESDWRPESACITKSYPEVAGPGAPRLADLAERISTGFAVYGDKRQILRGRPRLGVRLIAAKNFRPTGGLDFSRESRYIRRDGPCFSPRALVRDGDLLFVRVGVACCGRVAVAHADGVCQADDWLHIVRLRPGVDPHYVAAWLMSEAGARMVSRIRHGVGTVSISRSALSAIPVPRLGEDRERQIAELFRRVQQADGPAALWRRINALFAQCGTR